MRCYLGIDVGTSGVKAVVIDAEGAVRGIGFGGYDLLSPEPGWAEQDPRLWWEACDDAVRQAAEKCGMKREIAAIGFSGQQQGCTTLDKDMLPVGNSIIWLDQRSGGEVSEINRLVEELDLLKITANRCLNGFTAPKLLWLRKNDPVRYEKTTKALCSKDYLRLLITGETAADVNDASLSFLMDVPGRKWSEKMSRVLDIPLDLMPERLLESQSEAGKLRDTIADSWGLKRAIPVVAGGGDSLTGAVGIGVVEKGIIGSSIGTSGVVYGCADKPVIDKDDRAFYCMAHTVPGKWGFLGQVQTAGGSFKWLRDTFFADKEYEDMTGLAARACPGSEGLAFLPYLNGENTPVCDADARGVFFGLSYRHGTAEICRSVMEGVTFAMRDSVDICREACADAHEIRACGGGARSALWRQMQADIFNVNVLSMNMEEGPAAGAAILASVGAGEFSSVGEACSSLLKVSGVLEPVKENVKIYEEYYNTYKSLYPALKTRFKEQARIVENDPGRYHI